MWAIDTRHLPLYWFPRECPRGTFWATSRHDAGGRRSSSTGRHACTLSRAAWLERMRSARVVAYRLPETTFAPDPEVGGYWLSRTAGRPRSTSSSSATSSRGTRQSGIELRAVPNLWPLWNRVVASTLEFSGIRLHNALPPADA